MPGNVHDTLMLLYIAAYKLNYPASFLCSADNIGFLKLCRTELSGTEPVVALLADLSVKNNVDFVLSVSADPEELPDFLKRYLI